MKTENSLVFTPSLVEGLPSVTEVAVFPNRLELVAASKRVVIRFLDIARWYRYGWLWRPLARLGWVRGNPSVADRDWFHPPSRRFFAFYTRPPVVVYLPEEPAGLGYGQTMFRRVQNVISAGGFCTFDLG
jgi:hypothetical protein